MQNQGQSWTFQYRQHLLDDVLVTSEQVLEGHHSTVTALAHRHRYLISGSTDQTIIIWRTIQAPQHWANASPKWEKQVSRKERPAGLCRLAVYAPKSISTTAAACIVQTQSGGDELKGYTGDHMQA